MIVYSYNDNSFVTADGLFDDSWPLPFSKALSNFYFNFKSEDTLIFFNTELNAYMPVKFVKVKLLNFAQVQFAPCRNGIELEREEELIFLNQFLAYTKSNNIFHHLIQSHPYAITKSVPNEARSCSFGSYITDLEKYSDEELLLSYDSKYRKAIQHSIKNGAKICFGSEHINDFYNLYVASMSRAGVLYDNIEELTSLVHTLGNKNCCIGIVKDGDIAIGAILVQFTKYAAFVTHAGISCESKLYGALKYLHFEMMKRMKEQGVHFYDFVGVRLSNNNEALEGVFRFKKGFGGDLKTGYLWKTDLSPNIMKVYKAVYELRFKNDPSMKDIIDQENNFN